MAQTRTPSYIPGYGKSYALLSKEQNAATAIIFVHGFGGKPTSTWTNFHGLVDEYSTVYPWWATSDLFFYAYESLHTPIRYNADLLGEFVQTVWDKKWISPIASSPTYSDLIFAGHSEGGVVIRRLILDRFEAVELETEKAVPKTDEKAWQAAMKSALETDFVLRSYLRLFAPACRGTNFSSWAGFLTSFSHFVTAMTASFLVKNELHPKSAVLKSLMTGTERAHRDFPNVSSLYTRPLFGVPDQIVFTESYDGEKPYWDVGYDHFAVCKPSYTHLRPLEFVRK